MEYEKWLDKWLELYIKPSVKFRTYQKYESSIRLYILPRLGHYEMKDIDSLKLQEFSVELSRSGNTRTGGGLAAITVGQIVAIVQKSLKKAVSVDMTDGYRADGIEIPRAEKANVECFTESEQKKIERYILEKNNTRLYGILLTLYSGLRIGELLSLEWSDVDMKSGIISVRKTCRDQWKDGVYIKVLDSPKTAASVRQIPLPKQILPIVRQMKKQSRSNYVVSGKSKETPLRSYQRTFENILQKINIPHRGFHSLRHTFATRALERGMDVKTLSEILGHKNPSVTLNRYVHSLTPHKRAMMNKVGGLFLDIREIRK